VAGDRDADYSGEQQRIKQDFASGVRFVVDPTNREIRGFVPVDRGSQEAFFFTAVFDDGEAMVLSDYLGAVEDILTQQDRWEIRTDTPEKELLSSIRDATHAPIDIPTIDIEDMVKERKRIRIGVPGYKSAIAYLSRYQTWRNERTELDRNRVSVISLSQTVHHMEYDLLYHVSRKYDSPTVHGSG
jgi:hypothetical protein